MRFGSLFAGVGGFDLGLEAAGWECGWQVEWDKNCQQTLAYHWPDVPKWWDVATVRGCDLPPVDVITFGSPCQDLSIAGKQAGLHGERSGMFFEAIRIIREMRDATGGTFPRWIIWENVPGALSSRKGDDFEVVLREMANLGSHHLEWSVLDARFFGVPQRRRRVFVLACLDPSIAGRSAGQILPVGASRGRNLEASGSARQGASDGAAGRAGTAGGNGEVTSSYRMLAFGHYIDDDCASALKARDYKDATDLVVSSQILSFDTQFGSNANVMVDHAPTLKSTQQPPSIAAVGSRVRRLTPVECERLMGWPDDHTLHRADGKKNSDTTRYKMCGNGVASPVAQWVAEQINGVEHGL